MQFYTHLKNAVTSCMSSPNTSQVHAAEQSMGRLHGVRCDADLQVLQQLHALNMVASPKADHENCNMAIAECCF